MHKYHLLKKSTKTIQSKLFHRYSVIFILIWCLLEASMYFYFYCSYRKQIIEQQNNQCSSINNSISEAIDRLDSANMNIIYSNSVKKYATEHLKLIQNKGSQDLLYFNAFNLSDLMLQIRGYNSNIVQLNYYDTNMNVIGAGMLKGLLNVNKSQIYWSDKVTSLNGQRYISKIHSFEWINGYPDSKPKISVIRQYNNTGYPTPYGYIETVENCEDFYSYIDSLINDTTRIYIFIHVDECIYPYKNVDYSSINHYRDIVESTTFNKAESITSGNELITVFNKASGAWSIILVQPKSIIWDALKNMQIFMLGILAISLIFSFTISYYMARKVSNPLSKLDTALKNINLENLTGETPEKLVIDSDFDEINHITATFNRMNDTMVHSIRDQLIAREEQSNAQILAIQAQMNPHFLYNNLATISVMAEEYMNDKIVGLCSDLSDMLRYISSKDLTGVTLDEELDHTIKYFSCLHLRYEQNIQLDISIPLELRGKYIPKLIIQPLVENISKYGLNTTPPWIISIIGFASDTQWFITVKDTGKGFSMESLEKLQEQIVQFNVHQKIPELQINGMGLLNIYIRLRLFWKEHLIFEVMNDLNDGGIVKIGYNNKEGYTTCTITPASL